MSHAPIDAAGTREDRSGWTRRQLLKRAALLAGGGAASALLAACGSSANASPTTVAASGTTAATGGSGGSAATTSTGAASTSGGFALAADQTLRYLDSEPPVMDPGINDSYTDQYVDYNVWEGLLDFDEGTNPTPRGATSWDVSTDGAAYTFHLRNGVNWTDGTPVTADDYVWTWKRNLDPATGSEAAQLLYPVKGAAAYNSGKGSADAVGVAAPDARTFQVTLKGPTGYFLSVASQAVAFPLPQTAIQKYGKKWVEPPNAISNGPFKLTEWKHDQQITLTRNDAYGGPKPTLTKVVFNLYADVAKSSLPAFENNELDYARGPWPADMARIRSDPALSKELHIFPVSSCAFFCFDMTNTSSPVSKLGVRQALYLALDREKLTTDVFQGTYSPAYTVVPPDIPGANLKARLAGRVKQAQQALSSAGYPGGKGVSLQLRYSQSANNDLLLQAVKQMWQENLGITLNLDPMESKAYNSYRQSLATTPYDLILGGYGSDYLDDYDWLNFQFSSQSDFWHTHWKNAQYESLVSQAAVDRDQATRVQLYQQAEAVMM